MAAKIYQSPLDEPIFDWKNIDVYNKACEEYKAELKRILLIRNKKSKKNVGEIIRFQVADGYAEYMIASMSPLELVHIPLGDCWCFQYVNLLTAKEVNEKLKQQEALKKLFQK